MKKLILIQYISLPLLATLFSCSNDVAKSDIPVIVPSANEITFSVGSVSDSRATIMDNSNFVADGRTIGIYANKHKGNLSNSAFEANVMNNEELVYSNAIWSYSPMQFWSNSQDTLYSFVAYSPYTPFVSSSESGVKIPFNCSLNSEDQVDLLYAIRKDINTPREPVALVFKHALSKVTFKIGGDIDVDDISRVDIVDVELRGLSSSAVADINAYSGDLEWINNETKATFSMFSGALTIGAEKKNIGEPMLLIPQPLDDVNVTVMYREYGADDNYILKSASFVLPTDKVNVWRANQSYVYNLNLTLHGVDFTVTVSDFEEQVNIPVDIPKGEQYFDGVKVSTDIVGRWRKFMMGNAGISMDGEIVFKADGTYAERCYTIDNSTGDVYIDPDTGIELEPSINVGTYTIYPATEDEKATGALFRIGLQHESFVWLVYYDSSTSMMDWRYLVQNVTLEQEFSFIDFDTTVDYDTIVDNDIPIGFVAPEADYVLEVEVAQDNGYGATYIALDGTEFGYWGAYSDPDVYVNPIVDVSVDITSHIEATLGIEDGTLESELLNGSVYMGAYNALNEFVDCREITSSNSFYWYDVDGSALATYAGYAAIDNIGFLGDSVRLYGNVCLMPNEAQIGETYPSYIVFRNDDGNEYVVKINQHVVAVPEEIPYTVVEEYAIMYDVPYDGNYSNLASNEYNLSTDMISEIESLVGGEVDVVLMQKISDTGDIAYLEHKEFDASFGVDGPSIIKPWGTGLICMRPNSSLYEFETVIVSVEAVIGEVAKCVYQYCCSATRKAVNIEYIITIVEPASE